MAPTSLTYDVFLSHNSHDKPLVEQIAQRLVDEAKLRPFLDKWHLIPGVEWQPELEDALRRSKTVAVFIGPSGNGPWHHEEMQVALKRAVREKQEFRVIPVLLPEADASSMSDFLQLRTWVDFSAGTNNDIAFQRLVAGILGKAGDGEFADITLPGDPDLINLPEFLKNVASLFHKTSQRDSDSNECRGGPGEVCSLGTLHRAGGRQSTIGRSEVGCEFACGARSILKCPTPDDSWHGVATTFCGRSKTPDSQPPSDYRNRMKRLWVAKTPATVTPCWERAAPIRCGILCVSCA